MSVNLVTLGMFSSGVGSGRNVGGGVAFVPDETKKPLIQVTAVDINELQEQEKSELIVKSIK